MPPNARPYAQRAPQSPSVSKGDIPLDWRNFLYEAYDPADYQFNMQIFGINIDAPAGAAATPSSIKIQVPLFVYAFRSYGWVKGTGVAPTFPYGIGIAHSSSNDWTNGQWSSQLVTGNGSGVIDLAFPFPREVPPSTELTVTINNAKFAGSAEILVDAILVGIEVRQRTEQLRESMRLLRR